MNNTRNIVPNRLPKIVDCNALDGVIKNTANATVPVITATTVVRDGSVWAMNFNGTTSKVDLGAYNNLTGDITICAWVKTRNFGGSGVGRIITNGQLFLYNQAGNTYKIVSDGATVCTSPALNVQGVYKQVIVTRTSAGVATFYINGAVAGSPTTSGTPVAGTTDIMIGNNFAGSQGFDGNIASVQVFSGLFTAQEAAQKFSAERKKFAV
jgi:hypothetical protein